MTHWREGGKLATKLALEGRRMHQVILRVMLHKHNTLVNIKLSEEALPDAPSRPLHE